MRPSLTELQQTEAYVQGRMQNMDALLFEVKVLTSPLLKTNVHFLQKTFKLLGLYRRKKLKEEVDNVHKKIFRDPEMTDFQQDILQLFNT